MDLFAFIRLAGGLALFLYGMSVLGGSLEGLSGGLLERVLGRLTKSPFRGVLLGAAVTAMIQSSSAATVMAVSLVDAGVLGLRQAIGVIMGANIGTTVTAHLLRLGGGGEGFSGFLSPGSLASLSAVAGILLFSLGKRERTRQAGQMLLGLGVLFTGMLQMEAAVYPLRELPAFRRLFRQAEAPLLGVLAGAAVTGVIQSSSASVGILQALSATGGVTWGAAVPLILGQNIGTCVTPILASAGGSKGAKRAACVHLLLNLLGSGIFLAGLVLLRRVTGPAPWEQPIGKGGIAWFHTFFNIAVTVIFFPLIGWLEKTACLLIPESLFKVSRHTA